MSAVILKKTGAFELEVVVQHFRCLEQNFVP